MEQLKHHKLKWEIAMCCSSDQKHMEPRATLSRSPRTPLGKMPLSYNRQVADIFLTIFQKKGFYLTMCVVRERLRGFRLRVPGGWAHAKH